MSKVIGGIFTVIGTLACIYLSFLYMNTSAFLNYNSDKKFFLLDTGLALPMFIFGLMLTIGLIFMFKGKEPNLK